MSCVMFRNLSWNNYSDGSLITRNLTKRMNNFSMIAVSRIRWKVLTMLIIITGYSCPCLLWAGERVELSWFSQKGWERPKFSHNKEGVKKMGVGVITNFHSYELYYISLCASALSIPFQLAFLSFPGKLSLTYLISRFVTFASNFWKAKALYTFSYYINFRYHWVTHTM